MSEYCNISTLLRLTLLDFKLHALHTAMLSTEHFTCCCKHGPITQLIKFVSKEPGHHFNLLCSLQTWNIDPCIHIINYQFSC